MATVYSRASMPTDSFAVGAAGRAGSAAAEEDGYWAVRVVRKDGAPTAPDALDHVSTALHRDGVACRIAWTN